MKGLDVADARECSGDVLRARNPRELDRRRVLLRRFLAVRKSWPASIVSGTENGFDDSRVNGFADSR